ncbi:MAG TPA: HAD family phosphatase [Bacteroidota bacterium]|nr:HAD family phosphatase [Bacteroidota bacterium]
MNIQAVIFDFGRVICDFDIGRFVARAAHFSSLSAPELKATMTLSMETAERYETGLMSSREFYASVCRLAALSMSEAEFVSAYTDIFTPIPSTIALVKQLNGHYRLGLLSNTSEWHFERGIKPVGIFSLFEAVTLSFEVHAMKPDPRIYADMLAKLSLPAEACVYIDDIAEYAAAARALGLRAIHYTGHEKLLEDLAGTGVNIPHH